jgi:hypothetical protein
MSLKQRNIINQLKGENKEDYRMIDLLTYIIDDAEGTSRAVNAIDVPLVKGLTQVQFVATDYGTAGGGFVWNINAGAYGYLAWSQQDNMVEVLWTLNPAVNATSALAGAPPAVGYVTILLPDFLTAALDAGATGLYYGSHQYVDGAGVGAAPGVAFIPAGANLIGCLAAGNIAYVIGNFRTFGSIKFPVKPIDANSRQSGQRKTP